MQSTRYLRTPEAATYCGLSPRTLEKLRVAGSGPPFHQPPGRRFVVYDRADLESWIGAGRRLSTSDSGAAA